VDDLGDRTANKLNPQKNQTGVGRTNEALRLAYVLLWLFARRLESSNPEEISLDEYQDLNLLKMSWESEEHRTKNYEKLMIAVCDELNIFVNGVDYPQSSSDSMLGLHIKDSRYLDAIAQTLGGLEGVVGFILAGNENCSIALLEELSAYDYYTTLPNSSTSSRALETLKKVESPNFPKSEESS
jgi:hypothetical protein